MDAKALSMTRQASVFIRDVRLKNEAEWDAAAITLPAAPPRDRGARYKCSLTASIAMLLVRNARAGRRCAKRFVVCSLSPTPAHFSFVSDMHRNGRGCVDLGVHVHSQSGAIRWSLFVLLCFAGTSRKCCSYECGLCCCGCCVRVCNAYSHDR